MLYWAIFHIPSEEFKIDPSYKIVISNDADPIEREAAEYLATALDSLYETSLGNKWISYDTKECKNEIILGTNSRQYSIQTRSALAEYGYSYKLIRPEKIVIAGSDAEATFEAVKKFLWDNYGYIDKYNTASFSKIWNGSEYVDIKGSTVLTSGKSYTYTPQISVRNVKLNGKDISSYTIVPAEKFEDAANILARNITRITGKKNLIDPYYSGDNAIYIGADPTGAHIDSKIFIFDIGARGSHIYIDSVNPASTKFAVRAFSDWYLTGSNSEINITGNIKAGVDSNLLREISSETHEISSGAEYKEIIYKDSHDMPVRAYAVIIDNGAKSLKMATPNDEAVIS